MQFIENHTILFLTIVYTATILIQIIFSVISKHLPHGQKGVRKEVCHSDGGVEE